MRRHLHKLACPVAFAVHMLCRRRCVGAALTRCAPLVLAKPGGLPPPRPTCRRTQGTGPRLLHLARSTPGLLASLVGHKSPTNVEANGALSKVAAPIGRDIASSHGVGGSHACRRVLQRVEAAAPTCAGVCKHVPALFPPNPFTPCNVPRRLCMTAYKPPAHTSDVQVAPLSEAEFRAVFHALPAAA